MENIKKGDIIYLIGDELDPITYREEIRGVCGNVFFSREILEQGFGITRLRDIEDAITLGWKKLED